MRSFEGISFVAGGLTLALLMGCSMSNIAGPTGGGSIGPAAIGTKTSAERSALQGLLLPGMPTDGTTAVHPFIDFGAMAKNKGATIAISVPGRNVVDLFTTAGTQVGVLSGFDLPGGLASDIKGDLYVVDTLNSRVQIYAAGFARPPATLRDTGQSPLGVDSFANGAYVAVTNEFTTNSGPGSVSIFKGSTPVRTITSSNLQYAYFCAFDGKGDLYVDGRDTNGNVLLGEIPNATSNGATFEKLTTTNAIGFAAGIQVTTAGQIAIADAGDQVIYTYDPPSGGSLGTPAQVTPLGASLDPYTFAFTKNMTDLYAADKTTNGGVFEYAYPAGGASLSTIPAGDGPFGTAIIPTQYPSSSR